MRKFLLGLLAGLVITILGIVIVTVAIGKFAAGKQPEVPGNAVLVLDLDGDVPETPPIDISLPFFDAQSKPTVRDLWASLKEAASDKRVKAILFEPRHLGMGWGKLQELRNGLIAFRRSGKPIYSYLQAPGSREYYVASATDRIFVSPDDVMDVKGFRIESAYFKNTLDKLGVGFEVDHIGKYKDAGDMLTRNSMTPETREVLNGVLDQLYSDFTETVGGSRHKTGAEMRSLIDKGPFMAAQAKQSGLIDDLGYEEQSFEELKRKAGSSGAKKVSIKSYARSVPDRGDHFALLVAEGDILRGQSDDSLNNSQVIASNTTIKLIRRLQQDKSVKGVVVRVDSPGGDAVASDEILHELKLLSKKKPLVISMSDVAASGGYFISMTGDQVLSYPNTITGSIGVIYGKPNLKDLYAKVGVSKEILTRGKLADIDSDYTKLSEAGRQKLHEGIESTYQSFVSKVAQARRKKFEQIDALAQGRVWMGAQAKQNDLVDQLGGLDQAVELLKQKAKMPSNATVTLMPFPERRGLLDMFAASPMQSVATLQTQHQLFSDPRLQQILKSMPSPALMRGGMLKIMPYQFEIH